MAKMCMFAELAIGRGGGSFLDWDIKDLEEMFPDRKDEDRLKLGFEAGQSAEPFSSDLFILLEGKIFLDIIKQSQNVENICKISGIDYGMHNNSVVFKHNKILIAVIDVDSRHSNEVAELLCPYAEMAKNVVTFSTKSMVDFRECIGDSVQDVTFVRGINSKFSYIKELKSPNMICGTAAGIASWRTFKSLPVESYVFFIRHAHLDKDSAEKVLKLLQELGTGDAFDYNPKRRQPSSLFL